LPRKKTVEDKVQKLEREKVAEERDKFSLSEKLRKLEAEKNSLVEIGRASEKNDKLLKELTEEKLKLSSMLKAAEEKIRIMDSSENRSQPKNLEEKIKQLESSLAEKDLEIKKFKETVPRSISSPIFSKADIPTPNNSIPLAASSSGSLSGIPSDMSPEKEVEVLREKLKKAEGEIKKAQMQGRILQKQAEQKSREDLKKAHKESESQYQLSMIDLSQELEVERQKLKTFKEDVEKAKNEKNAYESRYIAAETVLKDQNKYLQDVLKKVKQAQSGNTNSVLLEILSTNIPQFSTHIEMLRPNESMVKYGVPIHKIRS